MQPDETPVFGLVKSRTWTTPFGDVASATEWTPPCVTLAVGPAGDWYKGFTEGLSPERARSLASALVAAADDVDSLTRRTGRSKA